MLDEIIVVVGNDFLDDLDEELGFFDVFDFLLEGEIWILKALPLSKIYLARRKETIS